MLFKCIIIFFLSSETFNVLNAAETGGTLSKWTPETKAEHEASLSVLNTG